MHKPTAIFALVITTWLSAEARSAGGLFGRGHSAGGGLCGGSNTPGGSSSCNDDIWCPVHTYFSYYPNAVKQQTLREYRDSFRPLVPGKNPDVFAIPPLPYGPGRTGPGAHRSAVTTAPAVTPAATAAPANGDAAATPPPTIP